MATLLLSGCKGYITGYEYKPDVVYKVVKNGVTTFMTEQEIKDKKLDKANDVIIKSYKLMGNDVPTR